MPSELELAPIGRLYESFVWQVPTDGVHGRDRIGSGNTDIELSEWAKRMKLPMFVALADSLKMDQCLVFCRTNVDCDNLEVPWSFSVLARCVRAPLTRLFWS